MEVSEIKIWYETNEQQQIYNLIFFACYSQGRN